MTTIRRWLGPLGVSSLLALAVAGVAVTQRNVSRSYGQLGGDSGVYAVPQPEHLIVFSLGYRSALADLLYGKTLVEAGIHFVERRVFEHMEGYLWGIIGLDPKIRELYAYADTMLTLSTVEMPAENFRHARELLERGLKEFPGDQELWMSAGMFISYVAPPRLPKSEDVDEWKASGAAMIEHACALQPPHVPPHSVCLSGAGLYAQVGKTEAAINSMERLLNMTDDPETRAQAMAYLTKLLGERAARERERASRHLEERRLGDLPVLDRSQYQLLLPDTDVTRCVGIRLLALHPECATHFAGDN